MENLKNKEKHTHQLFLESFIQMSDPNQNRLIGKIDEIFNETLFDEEVLGGVEVEL